MKALNVLLAVLVSALMALAVFEGGLRLIGKGPPASILEFDAHTGWRKKAGVQVRRKGPEYSVTIRTNELGLADDPMPDASKPAGRLRVVALGDSFTQGFTVDRNDLHVDLLERRWKAEGRDVDVINAGTEGWSTDQEVVWFLQNAERFDPDLVLLFAYENDLYWNGQPRYIDRGSAKPLFRADGSLESETLVDVGPRPWTDRLAIARLFKPFLPSPHVRAHIFRPAGASGFMLKEWAALLATPPDFYARSLEGTRGAFVALKRKCDELSSRRPAGSPPVRAIVVPIPSHSAVDPEFAAEFGATVLGGLPSDAWSPDRPVDDFRASATAAGLEALDPRAALRGAHSPEQPLYFSRDWHLNPAGNRVLASFLHDALDALDPPAFPASHRAMRAVEEDRVAAHEPSGTAKWPWAFAILWIALSALFALTYADERNWKAPLKVGAMLAAVFAIWMGAGKLIALVPHAYSHWVVIVFVAGVLGFVAWKLGRRIGTIVELTLAFVGRGHWYLMPLLVVLLSVGSLLVVAASSPLIAPFIYTLF